MEIAFPIRPVPIVRDRGDVRIVAVESNSRSIDIREEVGGVHRTKGEGRRDALGREHDYRAGHPWRDFDRAAGGGQSH